MCYNEVMLSEVILCTLITSGFAFAGVVVSNSASNKKNSVEQAHRDQQIEDKIQTLTDRVDKHNGMQDRIANMEKSITRIETKMGDIIDGSCKIRQK